MNRSEQVGKIAAALLKAQSEMGNALKDSKNPFFKSKYADLNSIREAVLPALNKHGITALQPMKIVDGRTVIETLLLHESGEWMSSETPVVVSKQNDPQAEGSGQTYARRYGLQSFLNVGADDDDGEASMGRNKPAHIPTAKETYVVKTGLPENTTVSIAHIPSGTGQLQQVSVASTSAAVASSTPVEPLKRSSFRKPGKTQEAAPAQASEPTGEWN